MITGLIQPAVKPRVAGASGLAKKSDIDGLIVAGNQRAIRIARRPLRSAGVAGLDLSLFAFGYVQDGSQLTINDGYVYYQQKDGAPVLVASSVVTLDAASVLYIYVLCASDGSTASVQKTSTLPNATTNNIVVPLYKFEFGGTWECTAIYHLGNVQLFSVQL